MCNRAIMETKSVLSIEEVKAHNSREDCWVVIEDKVWDVTDFLSEHPGGSEGMFDTSCRFRRN